MTTMTARWGRDHRRIGGEDPATHRLADTGAIASAADLAARRRQQAERLAARVGGDRRELDALRRRLSDRLHRAPDDTAATAALRVVHLALTLVPRPDGLWAWHHREIGEASGAVRRASDAGGEIRGPAEHVRRRRRGEHVEDGGEDHRRPIVEVAEIHGGTGEDQQDAERRRLREGVQPGEDVVEANDADRRQEHEDGAEQRQDLADHDALASM
jgi:hypothetical protein